MKKILVSILSVLMLVAAPITAYATEGVPSSDKANVKFYITDETKNGYPGSSFTVNMKDKNGTISDSYQFTKGNSWGNNRTPVYTMSAPATYTVTVDGMESGYTLVDTLTRDENITFETTVMGNPQVLWSIVDKEDDSKNEGQEEHTVLGNSNGNYTVSNEGADEIYKNFLDATAFISESTEWKNNFLQNYELFPHAERYAAYVEGGTEEDYLAMSLYDRFVWSETYLKYAWAVNTGNFNSYFGSKENFQNHITNDIVNMMKNISNSQSVIDAYLALANWQYDYVKSNGVPFNFINNRSYLVEMGKEPTTGGSSPNGEDELQDDTNAGANNVDTTSKPEVEEKGIWDDTAELISGNVITIGILLIVLALCGGVIFWRKRKNVSDIKQGDTNVDASDD